MFNTTKKLKSTASLHSNENNEDESELIQSSASSTTSSSHNHINSSQKEVSEHTSELSMLLSKLNVKNLLAAHDQVAIRYDQQKDEQQQINKAVMLEQQTHQLSADVAANLNLNDEKKDLTELTKVITTEPSTGSSSSSSENEEECEYENFVNAEKAGANNVDQVDGPAQQIIESNGQFLSDEGRFLLSKAQHYAVDNLKLVNIEKPDAPLGATIRNRDGCIVIGRIVVGGAAEQSGLLHEDDEILEINNIPVRGKTINDVCDMLCDLQGIVSFLIIPNMSYEPNGGGSFSFYFKNIFSF